MNPQDFARLTARPPMSSQRRRVEAVMLCLATAGITASIAGVFLKMRDNFTPGGGGPGISVGIICTIFFVLISLRGSVKLRAPAVALFAWPLLFAAISWNLIEFGIDPPGQDGTIGTRVFLGVLTLLIAVAPLLIRVWFRRAVKNAQRTMTGLFARGGPGVRIVDVDVTAQPQSPQQPATSPRIIEAEDGRST